MFRKTGSSGGLFGGMWKTKNVHSLEHLKYLCTVLYKNQTVTESNCSLLVETLRSIAEILIWGDQNDSSVFDFFLERNMLSFFLKYMNQKCGSYVCVQLLQTLNILFENIQNETSIYYLLSNNHVNSIIVHRFDFSEEEVMAYYISFLKTLSFRLNKHTIHFFYNDHTNDFPLYTEAIKFFNHSESMVRIAVRTITLNVFRVDEDSMHQFIIDKTAVPYFSNLVWFIGNHILDIDACVRNDADHQNLNKLKNLVAEHLDHLHYLNDILCLNIDNLNKVLTDHLMKKLFIPLYVYSLIGGDKTGEKSLEDMKPHVSKVSALFLLSHVFFVVSHAPLVEMLAWILFEGDKDIFTERGAAKLSLYSTSKRIDKLSKIASQSNPNLSDSTISSNMGAKPSFTAPDQSLETSLHLSLQHRVENLESRSSLASENQQRKSRQSSPNNPKDMPITDEEKHQMLLASASNTETRPEISLHVASNIQPVEVGDNILGVTSGNHEALRANQDFSVEGRPFLRAIFEAMNCPENDYLPLFALSLLYSIQKNEGIAEILLASVGIPSLKSNRIEWYNILMTDKLLQVLYSACQYTSKIRLVTLNICIHLIKQLALRDGKSFLADNHFAEIEGIKEESTLLLRNFYKTEEIFLDMFEDEYRETTKSWKNARKIEFILSDASLLLPPTGTPLTGIEFTKRLPCGEVERARKAIRTFFSLRQLSLDLQEREETQLPLSSPDSCVQVHEVLDLNNSDLLAVSVTSTSSNSTFTLGAISDKSSNQLSGNQLKHRFFLVIGTYQIVLVEPDATRLGWGVAIFAGFLQDLEVVSDKEDSRCLHITVHAPASSSSSTRPTFSSPSTPAKVTQDGASLSVRSKRSVTTKSSPILSATFAFDDHIRCMAAKQRLTKGREKARQRKMHQIAKLLELPGSVGPSCPSPTPSVNLHSLRQTSAAARRTRNKHGSQNQSSSSMSSRTQTPKHTRSSVNEASGASSSKTLQTPLFGVAGRFTGATAFGGSGRQYEQESNTSSRIDSDDEDEDTGGNSSGSDNKRQHQKAVAKLSRGVSDSTNNSGVHPPTRSLSKITSQESSHNMSTATARPDLLENAIVLADYGPSREERKSEIASSHQSISRPNSDQNIEEGLDASNANSLQGVPTPKRENPFHKPNL